MKNFLLDSFAIAPKGKRSLAAQLGFCFTVILVILIVASSIISSAYTSLIQKNRSDDLRSMAISSAMALSNTSLQNGMAFPLSTDRYIYNVYTDATGTSFLCVYTSQADVSVDSVTISNEAAAYRAVLSQQEAVVVTRSEDDGTSYVAGVAPIINSEGTVSGIVEVAMPVSQYDSTLHGLSLSWIFTMLSIAAALTIIYYETHKLLTTLFGQPDRQLPKIIRYGLSSCQTVSFFSAMACSMPPLVIYSYLHHLANTDQITERSVPYFLLIAGTLFAIGFVGFVALRGYVVRGLTARIALVASVFAAIVLMILSSAIENVYVYILLVLPIGFCLGMVFYFQREYRIYAGRLGYEEFSDRLIHLTQYSGYIMGASVGAVLAGIIFERFGLLVVSIVCGCILLVVSVQALLFVQHCPPSSKQMVQLPNFIYALTNKKSGSFLWSSMVTNGIMLSFFVLFVPTIIQSGIMNLSLATVSFYFMAFSVCSRFLVPIILELFPEKVSMQRRMLLSSFLQVAGYLVFALSPTAKMLLLSVILLGTANGLQEMRMLTFYKSMIREDKHQIARGILETAFALGVLIGAIILGSVFLFDSIRIVLLIFTLFMAVLLFAYPLIILLYAPSHPSGGKQQDPIQDNSGDFGDNSEYTNQQSSYASHEGDKEDRYL